MKSIVTIGTFDGLHRGHQALLRRLRETAHRLRLRPVVALFHRPPRFFLRPALAMPLLTSEAERIQGIRRAGIRRILVLRFNAAMARMPHPRFFERFLLRRCDAGGILVGPDFAFGKGRLGDIAWLRDECRKRGLYFETVPLLRDGASKASSSRIREALLRGDVAKAARLLGSPYQVSGRVIRGRGVGGKIGIPTANLLVSKDKFVPRGVYQVRVGGASSSGKARTGVCNVGTRPTFGGRDRLHVEIHIPGFSGNLRGRRLTVEFIRRLRGERRFPSVEALVAQIRRDIGRVASRRG